MRHGLPPLSMRHGAEGLARLVERWPEIDALVCASDPIAFGAITECQRRGIEVPARIAIGGFGDFEIARCAFPGITTVAIDATMIGMQAGTVLGAAIEMRRRGKIPVPEQHEMPMRLIQRASTTEDNNRR